MNEEETKVAAGMAGFWAGILLGLGLFGFPVRASDLPSPCCVEWRPVEHVSAQPPAVASGKLPSISESEACDVAESRRACPVP